MLIKDLLITCWGKSKILWYIRNGEGFPERCKAHKIILKMEPHSKNGCRRNSCKRREGRALGGLLMRWNKRDSRGNGQVNFLPVVLALLEPQGNILMMTLALFAILPLDPGLVLDYCFFSQKLLDQIFLALLGACPTPLSLHSQ